MSNASLPVSSAADKSAAIDGTVGALLGLTWIAVTLRLYVRFYILKKLHITDYCIILTQIFLIFQAAFIFVGVIGGIGNSNFVPTPNNIAAALRNQLIIELFFCIACTLLRVSIGAQLWPIINVQIASRRRQIQRFIIFSVVSIMVAFGIAWFFTLLFQCNPIQYFWNRIYETTPGTCLSNNVEAGMAYTQAILSAVSDFILGLLPIWIVWDIKMPRKLKASVAGLLGIGISAGVVAIVRLVYTKHLIFDSNDFFGDPCPVIICAFLEVSLGVLATCIATYKPFFSQVRGKVNSYFQSHDRQAGDKHLGSKFQTTGKNAEALQTSGIQVTRHIQVQYA
ncbi:hypothetical protein EG329_001278 [Mollisiaceae sp. DMI_Dod_QoI]|nr:hypothetical protein EG329_001278 [Helotiales sp. DMI_Dod_QoI]